MASDDDLEALRAERDALRAGHIRLDYCPTCSGVLRIWRRGEGVAQCGCSDEALRAEGQLTLALEEVARLGAEVTRLAADLWDAEEEVVRLTADRYHARLLLNDVLWRASAAVALAEQEVEATPSDGWEVGQPVGEG